MYYVKCTRINAPEKAIANNGEITYAYYNPRFGITHTSEKDEFCEIETKREASKILRNVNHNNYDVKIIEK